MVVGARTPEDLETQFEDAFVMRDRTELGALYDDGAVLVAAGAGTEARGPEAIAEAVADLWDSGHIYAARHERVVRSRDTALVVSDVGVHVLRRAGDGAWRVAISLLDLETTQTKTREDV